MKKWHKLLNWPRRLIESVSEVLYGVSAIAIGCMTILVAYSACSRYLFHRGVSFVEEFAGLLLIACAFLSFAGTFTRGGHVRLNLLVDKLSQRIRRRLNAVTTTITLVYLAIVVVVTFEFTWKSHLMSSHSVNAYINLVPWMALMPLGLLVFGLVILQCGYDSGARRGLQSEKKSEEV